MTRDPSFDMSQSLPPTIEWHDDMLYLLDQTRLPHECIVEATPTIEAVWHAIRTLRVRGAPAIGVAAAYGLCIGMKPERGLEAQAFVALLDRYADYLESARPTAVNLRWAVRRMVESVKHRTERSAVALYDALVAEATRIHREDEALCEAIGENGVALIRPGMAVLTHCNAGALATTGIGTATAPLYCAHRRGVRFSVYADETRPLLQGARLTALELQRAGIDVTLITDNMAASMMAHNRIGLVIVGADRVAANGDVANKIGTLGIAIAARHFGIPFYVACPSSTLDLKTAAGKDIEIEERDGNEVACLGGLTVAANVKVANPAFDVTPHELVTGLITESGIVTPPYAANLAARFARV